MPSLSAYQDNCWPSLEGLSNLRDIRLPFCPAPPCCSNHHGNSACKVTTTATASGLPTSHTHTHTLICNTCTVAARKLSISSIGRGDKLGLSSPAALCRLRASETLKAENPFLKTFGPNCALQIRKTACSGIKPWELNPKTIRRCHTAYRYTAPQLLVPPTCWK